MWRFARCAAVLFELAAAAAFALSQTCGPLPPFQTPAGAPMLTPQQEVWLYQAIKAQSLGSLDPVADTQLNAEIDKVLARLAAALPPLGFPLQVHLIVRDYPDAFALPGGQIYITRPLVSFLRNEDELAGVMAHELGHEYARQLPQAYATAFRDQLGVTAFSGQNDFLNQFQRLVTWSERHDFKGLPDSAQTAADRAGLEILQRSGYDPAALPAAFARFTAAEPKADWLDRLLGRATPDANRMQSMLAELPPASCAAAPRDTAAGFQAWQRAVVAYAPPVAAAQLPGLIRSEALPPLLDSFDLVKFSPNGQNLLAGADDGIWVFSVHPLAPIFYVAAQNTDQATFTPDSRSVVLITGEGRVERWNLASHRLDFLRQIVVSQPACAHAGISRDGAWYFCVRSSGEFQLLATDTGAVAYALKSSQPVAGIDFSPGGRYLALRYRDSGQVIDLSTQQPVKLPGRIQSLLNPHFTFVSDTEVLGTNDPTQVQWQLAEFPSGKTLKHFKFGPEQLDPETSGPYLIYRTPNTQKVHVFDPETHKVILTSGSRDLDGYGDLFAGESGDGGIELVRLTGMGMNVVAKAVPPTASFDTVRDASASSDLSLLAVSTPRRGAVWDLKNDRVVGYLAGFFHSWLDAGQLWVNFDMPPDGMKPNSTATYIVVFDLLHGTKRELPPPAVSESISVDGPITMDVKLSSSGMLGMFKDTRTGRLLWSRPADYGKNFAFSRLLPGYGQTLYLYAPQSTEARRAAQNDPKLEAQVRATQNTEGAWLEVLDSHTGKLLHGFLLTPSPSLAPLGGDFGAGDCLYITDHDGRTFCYDDNSGEIHHIWYGEPAAAAPAQGLVLLDIGSHRLALYHGAAAQPLATYSFPHNVEYARFSADGRRLLILTQDETVYLLAVPAAGGVQ